MRFSTRFKCIMSSFMALVLVVSIFGTTATIASAAATPIVVDSTQVILEIGEVHTAVVTAKKSGGDIVVTDQAEWRYSSSSIEEIATVSKGVITGKAVGTATIQVTYEGSTVVINVTVKPKLTSLSLDPTMELPISIALNALPLPITVWANYSDSPSRVVSSEKEGEWETSDTEVVTVENKMFPFLTPVGIGEAEVTFSYQNEKVTFLVTVTPPPVTFTGLWFNDTTPTLHIGDTHQIVIKKHYSDDSKEDIDPTDVVKYTVDDPSIATISDSGLITAVSAGKATVQVAYNNMPALDITVTVTAAPTVVRLTANVSSLMISYLEFVSFPFVTAYYSDSSWKIVTDQVTWTSEDPTVATVSDKGTSTITGASAGRTNLIISFGGVTTSIPITVNAPNVTVTYFRTMHHIIIEPAPISLNIGGTQLLTTKAVYTNSTSSPLFSGDGLKYSSSNTSVATVDSIGLVKAVSSGTATITVSQGFKFSATVEVTVAPAADKSSILIFPTIPTPTQPIFNTSIVNINLVAAVIAGEKTNPSTTFADPLPSWGSESIDRATRMGIISGYVDNTFKANIAITRAEFAKMVSIAFGLQSKEASGFTDTQKHWAAKAIEALQGSGVVSGYGDGTFHPDQPISRAEMITILSRLTQFLPSSNDKFVDTEGHWASDAINAFGSAGIISGKGGGKFDPNGDATRAESVKIIIELLDVLTGKRANLTDEPTSL